MKYKNIIILFISLLITASTFAQRGKSHAKVRADESKTGDGFTELFRNVVIITQGNTIYSDYAKFYQESQSCIANGNVKIKTRQKSIITGKTLDYDGPTGVINIKEDVVMEEKDVIMKTPSLRYESVSDIAHYDKGAEMISGDVILISSWGNYNGKTGLFNCYDSVIVTHPDYTIFTDTMDYSKNGMSNFKGPTDIITKDYTMYCENGWYNKKKERVNLRTNAFVQMKDGQRLYGDSINYSLKTKQGEAFRNVLYYDTSRDCVIMGEYAENDEKKGYAFFSDNARGFMIEEGDTIFVSSDTMRMFYENSDKDDSTKHALTKVEAFRNVRIFRNDMQAICHIMLYYQRDSIMYMMDNPTLWMNGFQIDGDTVRTMFENNHPRTTLVNRNAFITSLVPKSNALYHQIKGRNLWGYHNDEGELSWAEIKGGKVEAMYYVVDEEKGELVGVNKSVSKVLKMYFDSNTIQSVNFVEPESTVLYPQDQLTMR
ncbi:MAG: hypothetical protein LBC68_07230, partial [Prevotellaceae bacterium]|nr:hypothetical protein [Prevotellaceae bacterium]